MAATHNNSNNSKPGTVVLAGISELRAWVSCGISLG